MTQEMKTAYARLSEYVGRPLTFRQFLVLSFALKHSKTEADFMRFAAAFASVARRESDGWERLS